jgi:hypothetical protein
MIPEQKARTDLHQNPWQTAIEDELVIIGIFNESHDLNPRKALKDIINWNVQTALDPTVSAEAAALQSPFTRETLAQLSSALTDLRFIQASALVASRQSTTKEARAYMAELHALSDLIQQELSK